MKKWINIELTNHCNLNCPLCATGRGTNAEKKGFMDLSFYRDFIDQCGGQIDYICFLGNGEPALHPRLLTFIRYASQKKIRTVCGTNGTIPLDSRKVIRSGLSEIYIGIDGATQAVHGRYRVGSSLRKVAAFAETLSKERKRTGSPKPEIMILTLVSSANESGLAEIEAMSRRIGADGIKFQRIADEYTTYNLDDSTFSSRWFSHRNTAVKRGQDYCVWRTSLGMLNWRGELQICQMSPYKKGEFTKSHLAGSDDMLSILGSRDLNKMTADCGKYRFCAGCQSRDFDHNARYIYFSKRRLLSKIAGEILRSPAVLLSPRRAISGIKKLGFR
jgi:MoaA/NifB/PqqE/SkfB family radical SAM enzyme